MAEYILLRPKLYTLGGTLPEVLALLAGIKVGQSMAQEDSADKSCAHVIDFLFSNPFPDFQSDGIETITQKFGGEDEVVAKLLEIAAEHRPDTQFK